MNKELSDPVPNDIYVNVLSEKLPDEDIRRIFAFHGEIQFPKSTNNAKKLKTEKQIVINFKTKSHLLRAMAVMCTKLEEIRKNDFPINSLPDNCLVHILSFLPIRDQFKIAKVCKRWRDISDRVFAETKELNLLHTSNNIVHSILKRYGPFIKRLTLHLTDKCKQLQMATQFCQLHQLTEIHLVCFSSDAPDLYLPYLTKLLKESAENLVHLEITGDVKDFVIDQVTLLHLKTLKILKIWNLRRETQRSLKIDLDQFPNLRELSCKNITILKNEEKMKPETSTNFEILELWENEISKNFTANIKFCKNLRKVILDNNYGQTNDDDILGIVKNCPKIQELHLDGSLNLIPQRLQALSEMPSLEILRIHFVEDPHHLQYLTNLKKLTIDYCKPLSEHKGFIQAITNLPKLSKLKLRNAFMLDKSFIERVSDIFNNGLRKTPIRLEVEGKSYTWRVEYDPDSYDSEMKLEVRRNSYESDDSELEDMSHSGSDGWSEEEEDSSDCN